MKGNFSQCLSRVALNNEEIKGSKLCCFLFLSSLLIEVFSETKEFIPLGAFFPLRQDSNVEKLCCPEKQRVALKLEEIKVHW